MLSREFEFLIISLYILENYSAEQIYEHYERNILLQTIQQIIKNADNETYINTVVESFIMA
jgi:hypothetical protein